MQFSLILISIIASTLVLFWFVSHETTTFEGRSLDRLVEEQEKVEKELTAFSESEVATNKNEILFENRPSLNIQTVSHGTESNQISENSKEKLENQLVELQQQIDSFLAPKYDPYPYIDFVNPTGFVNSEPFKLADLVGKKVILVKFTTYSCINCQNTYPYVIDWYEKYKEKGLEIVFVHTPEFAFEHKIENVSTAMTEEGITFPVVLDNNYETWRAYGNRYWPRMYLVDIYGNIVYDHRGEGAYAVTEAKIKQLLAERAELLAI